MKRLSRATFSFDNVSVLGYAAAAGKMEGEGPLGKCFDRVFDDNTLGESSWEKAESRLQQEAVNLCIAKSQLAPDDFDVIFSGDLLNQCIASTFGLRSLEIPHIGMYGACSTMASTLINAAVFVDSGAAKRCIAATSSHFSSSERQFRNPLQYGGQRTPTAQWTVTGSGAVAVGAEGRVRISAATIGVIDDLGVTDANNMGAAMAPAAASTIKRFLKDTGTNPDKLDCIMTGDLGKVGSELLIELLERDEIHIGRVHCDGGLMIFDLEAQDVHAGGSGCGCSACVLCGKMLPDMENGKIGRMLLVGTGALMSPTSSQQGESIPGIAHAVELTTVQNKKER